ncbi:MAG: pyrroline-5-carboxylate reductase [Desulfobacterales bacterium]|nr:pyrroline-5-carboxylate reductase [Desulfobacterales bacterium]
MNTLNQKIGFIGAGNMAEAMIGAILRAGLAAPENIRISDASTKRRDEVQNAYNVSAAADNPEIVISCGIVVLSVKPQIIDDVLQELAQSCGFKDLSVKRLFISIAAGIPISRIEKHLYNGLPEEAKNCLPVIRVMPNTPALVGAGMSGMCANACADKSDLETARKILSVMGKVIVTQEDKMDAVTAVSGSGPAYGFYLLEAMIDAGVKLGLERETASELAQTALFGALRLIEEQKETPESLRTKVTSPGGTTEAAIRVLDQNNVKEAISAAIAAAAQRSRSLSAPENA